MPDGVPHRARFRIGLDVARTTVADLAQQRFERRLRPAAAPHAGTRSVVSSLWKVPDTATSVLMFLFHDRLRELDPVDALRDAQLWMLRPDREPPPEAMPPELQERLASADPTDIVAWAGFTHAG